MWDNTPITIDKDFAHIPQSIVVTALQYQLEADSKHQTLSEVDQNLLAIWERMGQGQPTPPHISKILSNNILDLF